MGIKIKNLQTGEFEKFNIPALKGEKGEPGEIEPSEKVDYIGKQHSKLRDTMNANVDYIIKTAIGEFNYLDYEGQHITATNSIEGHAKSAILKGQTLVNLINNGSERKEITYSSGTKAAYQINKDMLVANKTYLLLFTVTDFSGDAFHVSFNNSDEYGVTGLTDIGNGLFKAKVNFSDLTSVTDTLIIFKITGVALGGYAEKVMLIPYQEEMENWDIPYFEGMQSVKTPVLTATGKNLFNMNNCYASPYNYRQNWGELEQLSSYEYKLTPKQTGNDYGMSIGQNVSLKKGVAYTVSFEYGDNNVSRFNYFNAHYTDGDDSTIISWSEGLPKTFTFTPTRDIDYVWFCMVWGTKEIVIVKNIQIEQGSQATPFEPHKSNILSCELTPLNQSMFEQGTFSESTPPNTKTYEGIKVNSGNLYDTRIRTKGTYKVVQGATYEVQLNDGYGIFVCFCKNGLYSATINRWLDGTRITFTVPNDCDEMFFALRKTNNSAITPSDYSRIGLKIHQEVVLRSLPNGVCDTLNLNTGECATHW